ncbi:MAG: TIGR00730 family Rossman fold protein [Pleurocapsa minor GSE-CHR-MK-17-07R]|jgi:uncharacterized protein (TIGR00730 family)|nr:TIGR00730 family Rossman fold protein [Pleurocapsa minor GSE-CHR-MK 17-07R]
MNICVYCSASTTLAPEFLAMARELGTAIAQGGHTLVYGGASVGSMGEVARAAKDAGGFVIGIIPKALLDRELAYHACDELVVTENMRDRKAHLDHRSDAFIALPGGIGTLEEVFEIMTQRQLGLTTKPLVMVNQNSFYSPLRALLLEMEAATLLRTPLEKITHFAHDIPGTMAYIQENT